MKYYYLFVWGDVEPELSESYSNEHYRDYAVRTLKSTHGDQHGIFWLNIDDNGKPEVGSYSTNFFKEEEY